MNNRKKLIVSHAPFWHDGSNIPERSINMMLATIPAVFLGITHYGAPAFGVYAMSISSAIFWEWAINRLMKRPVTIGDGNAALIGLLFAMMLPATMPWWAVIVGTFVAIVIGIHIFGGIGGNAFNPVALSIAILTVSWKELFEFNNALLGYDFNFYAVYPLSAAKFWGAESVSGFSVADLLMGQQIGGIGSTFGLGLIVGGLYLMARGFIRWEIAISFLAGVFVTAMAFNMADSVRFAGPGFHLTTGYTLIGAFFLATEDATSPVNFIPMLIYGAAGGLMTVLIRNIGVYVDGVIMAILVINMICPLVDKIRPKAIGKVA